MAKLHAIIRLTRIEHGLFASIVPVATYILTCSSPSMVVATILYISTLLAQVYLFTLNDIRNIAEDRINRPYAPLVTGQITLREAWTVTALSLSIGAFLVIYAFISSALSLVSLVVYFTALALGTLYNMGLKRVCLLGNMLTALTTSLTFLYGLQELPKFKPPTDIPLLLFLTAFIANIGREVYKTILDIEGDKLAGYNTVAIRFGVEFSKKLAAILEYVAASLLVVTSMYILLTYGLSHMLLAVVLLIVAMLTFILVVKEQNIEKIREKLLHLMFVVIIFYFADSILALLSR